MYPVVRVRGTAYERGRQYGEQARDRVHHSLRAYARVFKDYATWDWDEVTRVARSFARPIEDFGAAYLEEMNGIAAGARVTLEDVLAINVRTEIMFAAKVRASGARLPAVGECSVLASVDPSGGVRLAQNWDWLTHVLDTVVLLEAEPEDSPAYVTVVEAGLLAKFGLNSAGLTVLTNALVSAEDRGDPGVPYHVVLRALLDCPSARHALVRLQEATRSSSANYLIGHVDGVALDVEARPGGLGGLHAIQPDDRGLILHTNHFLARGFDSVDVGLSLMPDSPFRLQRLRTALRAYGNEPNRADLEVLFTDHVGRPDSVCFHPDPGAAAIDKSVTAASMVLDLTDRRVRLSDGLPCEVGYRDLGVGALGW